ncbi:hypothetical protein SFC43_17900 [Bacteroides sp. CR5/BHMF/2]|nr:hypothetical protein [Bacteroides sp. CR5/BHMF/2]
MKKVVLLIMLGLMVSFSVFAQQALKGTIRSKADKQPLPGVSVAIKGRSPEESATWMEISLLM